MLPVERETGVLVLVLYGGPWVKAGSSHKVGQSPVATGLHDAQAALCASKLYGRKGGALWETASASDMQYPKKMYRLEYPVLLYVTAKAP